MGIGILEWWANGNKRLDDKIKMDKLHYNNPLFHHSTIPSFHRWGKISDLNN